MKLNANILDNWQKISRFIQSSKTELQGNRNMNRPITTREIKGNKRKNKDHMIISIDAEKALDKTQHSFMLKTLIKVSIEGTHLLIKNVIYDKPIAYVILNNGKLKAFSLKSRIEQESLLLPILYHSIGSPSHMSQTWQK